MMKKEAVLFLLVQIEAGVKAGCWESVLLYIQCLLDEIVNGDGFDRGGLYWHVQRVCLN